MKTKQLFITLLVLTVLLSGISLVDAAGVWKNPTATPPGNNVDAPINVGTTAQDKAGVLRVTGFRSFFDAIFDTKVQIGTTGSMPSSLKLLVDGKVGAEAYCDRQGNNCVTSSGIPVSSNTSTSNTSGGASLGAPDYDSGWINFGQSGNPTRKKYIHNLGTENYLVSMEGRGPGGDGYNCPTFIGNQSVNTWLLGSGYWFYYNKTSNSVSVANYTNSLGRCSGEVRVKLWKYGSSTIAPASSVVND